MQRVLSLITLASLVTLAIPGSAQGAAVQLCVADMQVAGARPNAAAGAQLLKSLNKEKPDKALPIETVPIPQSAPEEALTSAKQKGCDYVVTTNQTETHTDSSWGVGATTGVNIPTFYVTTEYKLIKVGDGSEVSSGSFKASDRGSMQNAVGFTLKKIADKVTESIKKAGQVAK